MRAFLLLTTLALTLQSQRPAMAAEECANPYVVVVKKDHSTVEGILKRDLGEKGVLVEQGGRTVFIPEDDIDYVDEDCSRGRVTPPQPPAPARKVMSQEGAIRNSFIDMFQRGLRWTGGGCLSLGCGLCSTGFLVTFVYLMQHIADPALATTLGFVGVLLAVVGLVSGVFVGVGAGMIFGAQMSDYLRPELTEVPSGDAAPDVPARGQGY